MKNIHFLIFILINTTPSYIDCYEGCISLSEKYPTAQVAYWDGIPGHIMLLVGSQLIDAEYGNVSHSFMGEPTHVFKNITELNNFLTIKLDQNLFI
jgi:hypothetical protein